MGNDFHLLSVPAMISMGAEVKFKNKKCIVSKEGKDHVILGYWLMVLCTQ